MTMSEQYYNNAKEAQAKWAESVKSVFDEAKKAFEGQTFQVDSAAAGERVQQGIDQVFDFWSKAVEFNRDLSKKVTDANMEYLNVLKSQAEAAGSQYLTKVEEARVRAERVARQTQDALAKSAAELESSAKKAAERATDQVEKNVSAASDQTVRASQKATNESQKATNEQADKATAEAEKTASRRSNSKQA